VADEIRPLGVGALAYACHVGDWDACENLVDKAWSTFGRIDVLINNAGMAPVSPSMADITEKLFLSTVGVNLKGPLRLATLVGTRMVADGDGGAIINISSGAADQPGPRAAVYAAAKAGLNALTVALAIEYGPLVRVNAVGLGPTKTDASSSWIETPQFLQSARSAMSLGRSADPEEIVGTVIYLASDASSFTTGTLLKVDGGIHGSLDTTHEP
jgi:NAD(P)-dependent dehydrogenase (short-subunit alcohol dehydrogenase family)